MTSASPARVFRFAIDRGGTFTDVYAEMDVLDASGAVLEIRPKVIKLLSEDPANYPDAPRCVAGYHPLPSTVCVCVCLCVHIANKHVK